MQYVTDFIGGNFSGKPEDIHVPGKLSTNAAHFLNDLCVDVDFKRVIDHHTHIVGRGTNNSGCYLHPSYESIFHPFRRVKFSVLCSASGISNYENADEQYVDRLTRLARTFGPRQGEHARNVILALDRTYTKDGRIDDKSTALYVPNDYVFHLSQKNPDVFIPAMSVNPYRLDALAELEKWASRGVKVCKLQPVSMGIDLSDDECKPFYRRAKELGVTLLIHTGKEMSLDAGANVQNYGNPLLLRPALQQGCTVIAAHCGISGSFPDLDTPGKPYVDGFTLFSRLLGESSQYTGQLYGDLSGLSMVNRMGKPLTQLVTHTEIHNRILYGTDYPLPAVNASVPTSVFNAFGYITANEREMLNEVYRLHPFLFDFAMKRLLRGENNERFGADVFMNSVLQ